MTELKKINEGQVISLDGGYGVRISKDRISYAENQKTSAYCEVENSVEPYTLHVYWGTLKLVGSEAEGESRVETIIERLEAALTFLGVSFKGHC